MDLYDHLLRGDTSADLALQPGDVIFVPVVEQQVTISGAVKRPAKYEILTEESLEEIIDISGGVSGRAYLSNIRLERLGEDYRPVVKNLSLPSNAKFKIQSGDIISISYASSEVSNTVSLVGNVERPGEYEWKPGLRLKDMIMGIEDLLPKADMHYGLVRRKLENGTIKVFLLVPFYFFSNDSQSSVQLEKQDVIYFFSRDQPRSPMIDGILDDLRNQRNLNFQQQTVSVSGLVRFPGSYPLTDNMSLADLFNACGGLLDSSYSLSTEISRMSIDGSLTASTEHVIISDLSESNRSNSVFLEPYDHLHIKKVPYWSEKETVTLAGEFLFPGSWDQ